VSALVKRFLSEFAAEESEFERLKKREHELRAKVRAFSAEDRVPREKLYERRR
jgi:hypothetical protein